MKGPTCELDIRLSPAIRLVKKKTKTCHAKDKAIYRVKDKYIYHAKDKDQPWMINMSREELTSDSVSSFFSCRLSPWRELSFLSSQCEWFQNRTPLLTSCEKRNITCLFSSQVDEEGSGRPARWQTQKGDSEYFFQISNTTLISSALIAFDQGWGEGPVYCEAKNRLVDC